MKKIVQEEFPEKGEIAIETTDSNDNRSYHITSKKIELELGIKPKRTLEDAVREICRAFKEDRYSNSMVNSAYFNVRALKEQGIR